MYRKVFNMLSILIVIAVAFSAVAPVAAQPNFDGSDGSSEGKQDKVEESSNGIYIVQMIDDPAIAYEGGVDGLNATKPAEGENIDRENPDVVNYVEHLDGEHNRAVSQAGGDKLYDYSYTYNGFAADMTLEQANKLIKVEGVLRVTPDTLLKLDTSSTPTFLGLDAKKGLWKQLGGTEEAGKGVVVGIVDTGLWPENPSFSDTFNEDTNTWTTDGTGEVKYKLPKGWVAACNFGVTTCNNKVIGGQYFNSGFGGDAGITARFPFEYLSARDADGHGSHTSSTAAGNFGVDVTVDGTNLGKISGMAPHASISMYKVCWGGAAGGCFSSDSVAAIDQAVADGVDVINFSISGSTTSFTDPVEIAFFFAAKAGVFVAASAGNSGPTVSTVAHNSPWLTTVAAGSHDRLYVATATLGNGVTYTGVGNGAAVASAPLIASTAAGLAVADANQVRLCFSGTLDPAVVTGKIVVCDRGTNARVDKSLAVQMAGGVGMILTNTGPNSLNADLHFVPTVHLADTDRAAVLAYAATAGATASLSAGAQVAGAVAPDVASFSSRGPALAGSGDLLKPDIMAPGVDILAAVSPAAGGRDWDFLSGTSMSSPHMAGLAALIIDAHPDWTPMMVKSAFMTTASQTRNNGTPIAGGPFDYGAGQVVPNSAVDPGLVYNSGFDDWRNFLKGQGLCNFCFGTSPATAIDASNLNLASIAIGDLPGKQTVTRTVTNVGEKEKYTFSYTGLAGFTVAPSVTSFTIEKDKTKSFDITFTNSGAALNTYTSGFITWTGSKGHVVRTPVVLRPVLFAAPAAVSGSYNVTFGYTGAFTATARGMVPADVTPGIVAQDPDQNFVQSDPTGTVAIPVTIPVGTTYARFSLFNADVTPGTDMDLYVYLGTSLVGSSGGGTSAEEVNFRFSAPRTTPLNLVVYVHGWGIAGGTSSPFKLHAWSLGAAPTGNMTVTAPASATIGVTSPINLAFSGLAPGVKYLGSIVYGGVAGLPVPTIVRVDP
ncbi:MAG: S8 family serine peptidase [Chloroflexi bacterium]|nr:S8 family serine peptidase [Chloroflexota bacterium]